jgi:hypothetical protein
MTLDRSKASDTVTRQCTHGDHASSNIIVKSTASILKYISFDFFNLNLGNLSYSKNHEKNKIKVICKVYVIRNKSATFFLFFPNLLNKAGWSSL